MIRTEHMLITVLAFLPGITCLFWLALNPLLRKRSDEFRAFQLFLAITGFASLSNALTLSPNDSVLLSCFLSRQFLALLVIPSALAYLRHMTPDTNRNGSILTWLAAPVSLLFAESVLIIMTGTDVFTESITNNTFIHAAGADKAGRLIRFCSLWLYYSIIAVQLLLLIINTVKTRQQHTHIQSYNCLLTVLLFLLADSANLFEGKTASVILQFAHIILSAFIFVTSYSGLYGLTEITTLHDIIRSARTGFINDDTVLYSEDSNGDEIISDNIYSPTLSATAPDQEADSHIINNAGREPLDEDNLRMRFEDLIVTEQLFLRQGIKLSDLATKLNTNRTYISRLVNNTYNMSFSDYINTLRIDYAEQYLLHHRDAKQSDIASACGFPNASAFNNVFKKITGVTPKIWLATRS